MCSFITTLKLIWVCVFSLSLNREDLVYLIEHFMSEALLMLITMLLLACLKCLNLNMMFYVDMSCFHFCFLNKFSSIFQGFNNVDKGDMHN